MKLLIRIAVSIGCAPLLGCATTTYIERTCRATEPPACAGPFVVQKAQADEIVAGAQDAVQILSSDAFRVGLEQAAELIRRSPRPQDRAFWDVQGDDWPWDEVKGVKKPREPFKALAHLARAGRLEVVAASVFESFANRRTTAWDGGPGPVRINRNATQTRYEWANTFAHEMSHHAGFRHAGNKAPGNECSVPYVVGWLVEQMDAKRFAAQPQDAPCEVLRVAPAGPAGRAPAMFSELTTTAGAPPSSLVGATGPDPFAETGLASPTDRSGEH